MPDWDATRNLLCVRLDEMGDVLMTTPALRALKGRQHRRITLLTSPNGAEIARLVPEIDDVVVHCAPWVKSAPHGRAPQEEMAVAADLRRRGFDGAIIFTVFSQTPVPAAYLCYLSGISRRAAYCRENVYQLLTHRLPEIDVPPDGVRHEVRRQLDLAAALGFTTADETLSLAPPPAACRDADGRLAELGVSGSGWVLVHPGASAPSRRYPPEYFARVADILVEAEGRTVVFTGAAEESPLVEAVRAQMRNPSLSLAGRLPFATFIALVGRAPVLITNNTGPAHVAAALQTPVVVAYAQTNLQHTPWTGSARVLTHDVPCRYCLRSVCPEGHHDCLRMVGPESVARAAIDLLSGSTQTAAEVGA